MAEIILKVSDRKEKGKGFARRMRMSGMIPGVLYGKNKPPRPLTMNPKELYKAVSTEAGLNALIHLKFLESDGASEETTVLVKDLQIDSLRRVYLHADLLRVDQMDEVKVEIPLQLVGKAKGVKEGGIIQQTRRELEVFCRAGAIPDEITIDITELDIGDAFHLQEITLPEGVRPTTKQNVVLVSCVVPEEEVVEEVPAEVVAGAEGEAVAPEGAEGAKGAKPDKAAEGKEAPTEGAPKKK
jgi:large subunit ribosomal protein L25